MLISKWSSISLNIGKVVSSHFSSKDVLKGWWAVVPNFGFCIFTNSLQILLYVIRSGLDVSNYIIQAYIELIILMSASRVQFHR